MNISISAFGTFLDIAYFCIFDFCSRYIVSMSNRKPFHQLSWWAKRRHLQDTSSHFSDMNTPHEAAAQAFSTWSFSTSHRFVCQKNSNVSMSVYRWRTRYHRRQTVDRNWAEGQPTFKWLFRGSYGEWCLFSSQWLTIWTNRITNSIWIAN